MKRLTRQYRAIHDAIAAAGRPLLIQEILRDVSRAIPGMSLATVYRHVRSLQDAGTVEVVLLPGQNPRYEMVSRSHHHFFQCRQCERVFDIGTCPGNLDSLAPAGCVVDGHEIILYGRCAACAP